MCRLPTSFLLKLSCEQICLCQISGSWPVWFPRKMWQKLSCEFAYVHNIQSPVKQEVDMPQIQKCVTRYSSPYWCSVPNIRKLACVVPEKNVTKFFCDADADDARRQKWPLYVASAKAGRRHKNDVLSMWYYIALHLQIIDIRCILLNCINSTEIEYLYNVVFWTQKFFIAVYPIKVGDINITLTLDKLQSEFGKEHRQFNRSGKFKYMTPVRNIRNMLPQ